MSNDFGIKDLAFRTASEKWNLVDSLMGGTDSMRAASTLYLPKYSADDDELYKMRLSTSTLFNAYKKAVETNLGKITSRQIKVDGGSPLVQDYLTNVDATGRSLTEFSKDVLQDAINHGIAYIMVDFPKAPPEGTTLADVKTIKPHFVDISAQQLMSIKSTRVNGTEVLTYFKFSTTTSAGFTGWDNDDSGSTTQVREYALIENEVHYRVREQDGQAWKTIEEDIMTGIDFIPIVPVYGNRTGFYIGEPLLNDLAELNIRHWQASSDEQFGLHYASNPILLLSGIESRDENGQKMPVHVGPNSVITTDRTDADMKYVEHTGQAFATLSNYIKSLEDQMAVMGLDISVDKTGNMTATGRAINAASTDSILKSVALQLEDSLTAVLLIVEMFYQSTTPFTVDVNKEYIPVFDSREMSDIWLMYREGFITAGDVLKEAKRRNLITPQFIIDKELQDKMVTINNTTI